MHVGWAIFPHDLGEGEAPFHAGLEGIGYWHHRFLLDKGLFQHALLLRTAEDLLQGVGLVLCPALELLFLIGIKHLPHLSKVRQAFLTRLTRHARALLPHPQLKGIGRTLLGSGTTLRHGEDTEIGRGYYKFCRL